MPPGRVVVTGPNGRLGRALMAALTRAGVDAVPWARPVYDLDVPDAALPLLRQASPQLVIHAAAWTDVDGCAREPELAERRNGIAVRELATACSARGTGLVVISTNEVFDGRRSDGLGYREDDAPAPINAYGRSKLNGERAARAAFQGRGPSLWIVRTSWLFGPPGNDFPTKIQAAADGLAPGAALRIVADEFGCPTSTIDLAGAILELVDRAPAGTYHLANAGHTSRAGWARRVLGASGRSVVIDAIPQREYVRASMPPAWGVLDTSLAAGLGVRLRPWEDALDAYLWLTRTAR